jgi:cytochrome b
MNARIWDLPTRLFHWTLVLLIALQYATGEFNVLDMRWHFWFGYATLALVLFRVLWGFFGSQTSRFSNFVKGPSASLAYVRSLIYASDKNSVGHNPIGAWSVLALLTCLLIQAISGLFASDEVGSDGPFVEQVSSVTVKFMTRTHNWAQNGLLVLIALHVAAVLLYLLLRRDNLIVPMISGRKQIAHDVPLRFASNTRAMILLAACAIGVALLAWFGG